MKIPKKIVAAGLAAGLVGGGAAGAVLSTSGVSGAETAAVTQDDTTTTAPPEGERPDPGSHLSDALAPLVEDGTITQEQADAVVEAIQAARPEGSGGEHGHRGHHGPGGEAAAEALGMTQDELREALSDGSTIADVAAERGRRRPDRDRCDGRGRPGPPPGEGGCRRAHPGRG